MKKLDKLTYVKQAEEVIGKIARTPKGMIKLKTNKIRNMLTLMNELYAMAKSDNSTKLNEDVQSRVQYTKMKLIYEAGRDNDVKDIVNKSELLEYLDSIGDSMEQLMLVCRYMEALVAYHKFYAPKDN